MQQLIDILREAATTSKTEKTASNDRSSRSHCIYVMKIKYKNKEGSINLVDLAGSERSSSHAHGSKVIHT